VSKLIAKKKVIVDSDQYGAPARKQVASNTISRVKDELNNSPEGLGVTFLASAGTGFEEKDVVRMALGKNWNYQRHHIPHPDAAPVEKKFNNEWVPWGVFWDQPLTLKYCSADGAPTDGPSYPEDVEAVDPAFNGISVGTKEKIILRCSLPPQTGVHAHTYVTADIRLWSYLMKYGINSLNPIVRSNYWFNDHYHEGPVPFTPEEMLNKSPTAKAFFADYKTFYNERSTISRAYENILGSRTDVHNSIPSIYSLLRLINDSKLSEDGGVSLNQTLTILRESSVNSSKIDNMPQLLVLRSPWSLMAQLTLFGMIQEIWEGLDDQFFVETTKSTGEKFVTLSHTHAQKEIENIVTLLSSIDTENKNIDVASLYRFFFERWARLLNFKLAPGKNVGNNHNATEIINALERSCTNMIFDNDFISIMDKAEKYKKYFPFYNELQFTAQLQTDLGDYMKKTLMTKFVSDSIAAGLWQRGYRGPAPLDVPTGADAPAPMSFTNYMSSEPFTEFFEEVEYENIGSSTPKFSENAAQLESKEKHTIDFANLFHSWLTDSSGEFYHPKGEDNASFRPTDIRNYTSFIKKEYQFLLKNTKSQIDVPMDASENAVWKFLLGGAFHGKIVQTYKEHKRTYEDIINGVPAHAEDLFYIILKERANPGPITTDNPWHHVQTTIMPNTSELDIVKHIDTQLKYGDYVKYRYTVSAARVVYGAKYRYLWNDATGNPEFIDSYSESGGDYKQDIIGLLNAGNNNFPPVSTAGLMNTGDAYTPPWLDLAGYTVQPDFSATLKVEVQPSIKIVEDVLFTTPEITLYDRPPIPPQIDIIPYRGISNRIKIMLDGSVDRYRAKPINMLDTDNAEYQKLIESQLSTDGKIEFGSDDAVSTFQVFRIGKRPKSYSDFELHPDHDTVGSVLEERVLPNTKYYYTFRAIDGHGHISLPSPVYEVELIDDNGAVKPVIRTISMDPTDDKKTFKDCQKYIYIKPTPRQLMLSEDPSVDSIFSSQETKRKFKIRVTSKNTGRKIDMNFSFRKKFNSD
tara:strand:+ start:7640 stop:10723 length:3084 start_codon:yes stop_codon:yes gene_type:complete